MATTTVTPAAEPQAPINHFGRVLGVFFSPGKTIADVAKRPTWIVPVILMTLFSLGVSVVMSQKVDWRDVAAKRIEESSRASQMSADQKEQQIAMGAKISPYFAYGFGLVGPILFVVIVGGVMLGAYNLIGGADAKFTTALGIVAHASLVTLISSLLFIVILFVKPSDLIDLENPVATNIGAILPAESAKWLLALGKSFDIFTIWVLILIAIGFAAVNPKKLKGGTAYGIAFGVWAAFVVCRVGIAWVFS